MFLLQNLMPGNQQAHSHNTSIIGPVACVKRKLFFNIMRLLIIIPLTKIHQGTNSGKRYNRQNYNKDTKPFIS